MARQVINSVTVSDSINLVEIAKPHGDAGWWLYDECRGMNLAMKAKTERDAFSEALKYYQRRFNELESAHKCLTKRVHDFTSQFHPDDNE